MQGDQKELGKEGPESDCFSNLFLQFCPGRVSDVAQAGLKNDPATLVGLELDM